MHIYSFIRVLVCLYLFIDQIDLKNVAASSPSTYLNITRNKRQSTDIEGLSCTLPNHPDNGRWIIANSEGEPGGKISKHSILIFECSQGYKLSSSSKYVVCDENWNSQRRITCDKSCPAISSSSTVIINCVDKTGKEINCTEAAEGSLLTYDCAPYYETPFGFRKNLLCADGRWSPEPICQPVCGKRVSDDTTPLIYGGKVNKVIEYPWVTALYMKTGTADTDTYTNICGGSIITPRIVLTAAHCVTNDRGEAFPKELFQVAAGKLYNKYMDPRDPAPQYLSIFRIILHQNYKGDYRKYIADLAILVTYKSFVFTKYVQPVCFNDVNKVHLHPGNEGAVSGWGLKEGNIPSEELRTLELTHKYEMECAQELPADWVDKYLIDKICAGFVNKSMSVCQGDSGNSLAFKYNENNRYYIHGIVSLAYKNKEGCNIQQNSLYTKVANYYDFINQEISKYFVDECLLPPYPNNGKWTIAHEDKIPGDAVPGSTILEITCNQGFKLSTEVTQIDCDSAIKMPACHALCPKLKFPRGTDFNCKSVMGQSIRCTEATDYTTLTYTCPDNYSIPEGTTNTRQCINGSWGTPKPRCLVAAVKRKKGSCPPLYSTNSTILKCFDKDDNVTKCDEAVNGTYLTYECAAFYEAQVDDKKNRLCVEGVWNYPKPVCRPMCGRSNKDSIKPQHIGDKRKYPWVAALFQERFLETTYVCGGSIISQRIVLTAANCVTNDYGDALPVYDFKVGVGIYYNIYQDPRNLDAQYRKIADIVVHPEYRGPARRAFDIAMLITEEPIVFNDKLQPVCYSNGYNLQLQVGNIGVVGGWGKRKDNVPAEELRILKMPYKPVSSCVNELTPGASEYYNMDQICAGFSNKTMSVCGVDRGNSLTFINPKDHRYYIRGILTIIPPFRGECTVQQNAFYTNVVSYYEFIDSEVNKHVE